MSRGSIGQPLCASCSCATCRSGGRTRRGGEVRLKFWEKDTARTGPVLTETRKLNLLLLLAALGLVATIIFGALALL